MKIEAIGRFILVDPLKEEEVEKIMSSSNFYIPQTRISRFNYHIGRIVSIGDGCVIDLKENDLVLYGNIGTTKLKIKQKEYIVITEAHLFLKIIEKEKN